MRFLLRNSFSTATLLIANWRRSDHPYRHGAPAVEGLRALPNKHVDPRNRAFLALWAGCVPPEHKAPGAGARIDLGFLGSPGTTGRPQNSHSRLSTACSACLCRRICNSRRKQGWICCSHSCSKNWRKSSSSFCSIHSKAKKEPVRAVYVLSPQTLATGVGQNSPPRTTAAWHLGKTTWLP